MSMLKNTFTAHYLVLCCILFLTAYSKNASASHDIHHVCQKSPATCLAQIDTELNKTQEQSRLWFNLLQYKLDALFNLKMIHSLKEQIAPWINGKELPIPFQVSVYIYHIKTLPSDTSAADKQYFIDKAKKQLTLLNDIYPNPIKLVELANLQVQIGEVQEAFTRLQALENKYARRNDPLFQMELYANLGHAAHRLDLAEEKIEYYIKALEWSIEYGNQQQIAVSYYNVAKSQLNESQFKQSANSFSKSVKYARSSHDTTLLAQAQLFLAQSYIELKKYKDAHLVLSDTQLNDMPVIYKALYQKLLKRSQQHVN
jgi:tetratricopeptide (TPR) repeat protein